VRQEFGRSERWEQLADALARLGRELADARREIVVLRRENAALRGRLADVESGACAGDASGEARDALRNGLLAVRGRDG
jgi:hypothetical protein